MMKDNREGLDVAKDEKVVREMATPYESAPFGGAPGPWLDRQREEWESDFVPPFEERLTAANIVKLVDRWRHLEWKLCRPLMWRTPEDDAFVLGSGWVGAREELILVTKRLATEAVRHRLKTEAYVSVAMLLESADPRSGTSWEPRSKTPWFESPKFEECELLNRQLSVIAKAQGPEKRSVDGVVPSRSTPPKDLNPPDVLVTVEQVSKLVHVSAQTLRNKHTKSWPGPKRKHSGRAPALYSWRELLPVLRKQYSDIELPESFSPD